MGAYLRIERDATIISYSHSGDLTCRQNRHSLSMYDARLTSRLFVSLAFAVQFDSQTG